MFRVPKCEIAMRIYICGVFSLPSYVYFAYFLSISRATGLFEGRLSEYGRGEFLTPYFRRQFTLGLRTELRLLCGWASCA